MSSTSKGPAGLAERYASALFDIAETEKSLDPTASELQGLADAIKDSSDLGRLIGSPVISRTNQRKAMEAILTAAGASMLVRKFVGVLAERRRLFVLPEIIRKYQGMLAARRGETVAEVTAAEPLSKAQISDVTETLKRIIGKNVVVKTAVDPALLGGLVVRVGSRMIDSSLQTKLRRLSLAMKGIG